VSSRPVPLLLLALLSPPAPSFVSRAIDSAPLASAIIGNIAAAHSARSASAWRSAGLGCHSASSVATACSSLMSSQRLCPPPSHANKGQLKIMLWH
jgi:hypothetical protein